MANYYITTSIPYANAEPHIGFAYELICADVLARVARARGDQVIFSTGTDEHGTKIYEKAAEANEDIVAFTDRVSKSFRDLCDLLNVSNNRFIRTTDEGHIERSQLIWKSLSKDIYKGYYEGWYCTGEEAFFPEAEVKANKGICPVHNRPYEKIKEENYFFKLSAYQKRVEQEILAGNIEIIPATRKNEILSLIKSGLTDLSVSRPVKSVKWGIPVPGDKTQVMYVWIEALMNYLTVLGYPENKDFKDFWPPDVQVIGKDILRFHAAIWPAMLMSLNLELPKTLYVHGHINTEGKKMSKSLGNVIHPKDIVEKYGADAFRYYFLRHIPSYGDGDFSMNKFITAYNNELANELGNALSRTVAMIKTYQSSQVGSLEVIGHDVTSYTNAIANCQFDRALDEVWEHIKSLNQYIDDEKPWELAKAKEADHLREVLAYQASSLLFIAELLLPFLPKTAGIIKDTFKDSKIKEPNILFPKFDKLKVTKAVVK